jgi:protein TonB
MGGKKVEYTLSDDLARLCLPQELKDAYRTLAWINSICALFLAVGLVGLKEPPVIKKDLTEVVDPVPVVFTPPEEQPKPTVEEKQEEPEQVQATDVETVQVVTIVAPADAKVAFPVEVKGPVMVAKEARLATPPPLVNTPPPSRPQQFIPNASNDAGSYPPPLYPTSAQRSKSQGTVMVEIKVDPTGTITSVAVQKSSGFSILDEAAMSVVKNRWRFPPGPARWLVWPCEFKLR